MNGPRSAALLRDQLLKLQVLRAGTQLRPGSWFSAPADELCELSHIKMERSSTSRPTEGPRMGPEYCQNLLCGVEFAVANSPMIIFNEHN